MRIGARACLLVLLTLPAPTQQIGDLPQASDRMSAIRDNKTRARREAQIRARAFEQSMKTQKALEKAEKLAICAGSCSITPAGPRSERRYEPRRDGRLRWP